MTTELTKELKMIDVVQPRRSFKLIIQGFSLLLATTLLCIWGSFPLEGTYDHRTALTMSVMMGVLLAMASPFIFMGGLMLLRGVFDLLVYSTLSDAEREMRWLWRSSTWRTEGRQN